MIKETHPADERNTPTAFLTYENVSMKVLGNTNGGRRKINISNLPAVDYFLIEDAKFIANTVTIGSQT